MLPIFVVIGLFVAPSAEAQQVVEIAPDVFVRAGGRSSATGANQAFIVFDSFVVVFDAGGVVEARTLLSEIEARTAKPVRYVVSSHFHPDHSAGAAVFAGVGAQVVAHKGGQENFEGWAREDFAAKIEKNPEDYRGVAYSPPTRYLLGTWVLDDGEQRLELRHYGRGHAPGDLVGWMPRRRILFAGDLSTNGQHNLASASLAGWITVLESLMGLGAQQVVPGHLELAGPEILEKSHRYLVALRSEVSQMVARGLTYDESLETIDIPLYEEWTGFSVRDDPTHVRVAYVEAGGQLPPPPMSTKRRLAWLMVVVLVVGVPAVMLRQWSRRRSRAR